MSIATIVAALLQTVLMTSVGYLLVVILLKQNNNQLYRLLLMDLVCVFISNAAYLLELRSTCAAEALVSLRVYYMVAPFTATLFLALMLTYFSMRFPKKVFALICIVNALVAFSVWTSEFNHLYYTSVSFASDAPLPHTVLGKGPLYIVFAVMNAMQITACAVISCVSFIKAKDERQRKIHLLLVFSTLIPLICYVLGSLGLLYEGYDPVPAGTAIGAILFSFAVIYQHAFELVRIAYKSIIGSMDEAVLIADYSYGFVEANESALRLFPRLRYYRKGQSVIQEDEAYRFKDGNDAELTIGGRVFHIQKNTIMDEGFLSGYAFILVDITHERKQLAHMQSLKEKADSANQAKSTFLAHISHEIRTPINAVFGMDEMILRESAEPETKRYAFEIKNAVNTLLSIVNDILDFSKIESGKMKIVEGEYELNRLLNDVYNMTSVKAQEKQLALTFDIAPELPSVLWGDDIRIRQILLNLLSNGVKYTREGNVSLHVSGQTRDGTAVLRFLVEDTGIGMKKEELPRLFEAFERVDVERNRHIEGTGLGMSITVQLLKMMGSAIEVESQYGKGSSFSFSLEQKIIRDEPIGDFMQSREQPAEEYAYSAAFVAPEARVLVVDDSRTNRMVFRELLKDTQVQIYEAESGAACLRMIENESFDIIFMDDMMPEMSGSETLAKMKAMGDMPCKDVPVIMLTANAILGAKEKYLKLGFADFLTKPIDPLKLEAVLGHGLNLRYVKWRETNAKGLGTPARKTEELPEIEGVDWESARRHLPGEAMIRQTALQFCDSIPEETAEIQELIGQIEDERARDAYRIRVHTIKGSAAMLGMLPLSGLAQMLETAARTGNTERLKALHPVLTDELKSMLLRLQVLRHTDKNMKNAEPDKLLPLLAWLKSALGERDYDVADDLAAELLQYNYTQGIRQLIDVLQTQIMNLSADAAILTAEEIEARMKENS